MSIEIISNDAVFTLPTVDLFQSFADTAKGWVDTYLLDDTVEQSLIGFELTNHEVSEDEGSVIGEPLFNDVESNVSGNIPQYEATNIYFKGFYDSRAEFEAANPNLFNGIAYHQTYRNSFSNKSNNPDAGYVWYNGTYYELNYSNLQGGNSGATYTGEFGAGLFPNTTVKWKNIVTGAKNQKQGWPPPLDDVMSQFLYSVSIDSSPSKTRGLKIKYYVKSVVETTSATTSYQNHYTIDTYTYDKVINNTLTDMIGEALEDFFDQFPEINTKTGEIIG